MKKKKIKLQFADMPQDYTSLCGLLMPRPIHDAVALANSLEMAEVFAGFEGKMSADQEDYFNHLCTLVSEYERETLPEPEPLPPVEFLRHLLEEHGLSGADLSKILGATSRFLGPMILRGDREITADHARALAKHFGISSSFFIG